LVGWASDTPNDRLGISFLVLLIDAIVSPRAFFDIWLMTDIQQLDAPGLVPVFHVVESLTRSEGAIMSWGIALIVFLMIRWWAPAITMAIMPIGGVINEGIGKLLVDRSRPHLDDLARTSSNWEERSFPSGHVMGAVLFYGVMFVVAKRIRNRAIRLGIQSFSVGVVAIMGIERVWEGAHWPTDVLGAYTLGGLVLIGLIAIYERLDGSISGLPLITAAPIAHDESRKHVHALTSLVLFDEKTVSKIYEPGLLPRAIYWVAFQAPFGYIQNKAALTSAMHRRNLASRLTEFWYGESRVARVTSIDTIGDRYAVTSERVEGTSAIDPYVGKAFLRGLQVRFEEAGLPTWQIDPRQPRAIDNLLQTPDGSFQIVDLESGLVSPMASLTTWKRALRRGMVPFYDDIFFDITRDYVAKNEADMRSAKGDAWVSDLMTTLDAAESDTASWHRSEPRVWNRLLTGIVTGFSVRTWSTRIRARFATGRDKGEQWLDHAVTTWEREERITGEEAAILRTQIVEPTFQEMLPYLGAHVLISIPLRFPLGTIVRPFLVAGALGVATVRLLRRQIDRETWGRAWSIHSPLVMILSAVPGFGSFAYLAAKPVRANRLLLRTLADAVGQKVPWNLYQRTGLRRFVARPSALEAAAIAASKRCEAVESSDEDPAWEFAWAARPKPVQAARPSTKSHGKIIELTPCPPSSLIQPAPQVA
jgi:undecaprenyl-diphosphatase